MTKLLVKFSDNYADEFDVEGYKIFTLQEWVDFKEAWKKEIDRLGMVEVFFGTNEYLEYDDYGRLLNCLDENEISDADANTLIALLGDSYGETCVFTAPDYFDEVDEEEETRNDWRD